MTKKISVIAFIARNIPIIRIKNKIANFLNKTIDKSESSILNYSTEIRYLKSLKIKICLSDFIQRQIFIWGYYNIEINQTRFFINYLKKGMCFFDIGANIGYYSLIASKLVGNSGQVYSFEPVLEIYEKLQHNINVNSFKNVYPIKKLVYNTDNEVLDIYIAKDINTGMSTLFPDQKEYFTGVIEKVNSIKIDTFINERTKNVNIIKIDVEGGEYNVLLGMKNLLGKDISPDLLIELYNRNLVKFNTSVKEVILYMNSFGYKPYKIINKRKIQQKNDFSDEDLCFFSKMVPAFCELI